MTTVKETSRKDWRKTLSAVRELMLTFPMYIVTHPFKGFDEMKNLKRGDMRYGVTIMVLAGLVALISQVYTGFVVTEIWHETPFVHVPTVLLFTYSPILLFCVANWSVTTITDGKGNMREIFLTYAYAMYPMLICTVIGVFVSNFLTLHEVAFATFFFAFGTFLQYFFLFIGLVVVHEYTFLKAVLMVFLTVLAMLVITFVLALMFSLFSNVIMIFWTVVMEINLHHLN